MSDFADPLLARIAAFLESIGIPVVACTFEEESFLPGVRIHGGGLQVDIARLRFPGDLLHEAGHIALTPAAQRARLDGRIADDLGEEIGAIAWSWAALRYLDLDPAVVFHAQGYRGHSSAFISNFSEGRCPGVPLLQWMGLTLEEKPAREQGLPAYPHMQRWLRD